MSHARKTLAAMVGALVLGAGAIAADTADSASNPYQGVVDRNVFALKPPPAPVDPDSIKPPLPQFYLTGIITFGKPRALLRTSPGPAKGGKPVGKEESYILTEGQRQGELEVNHIDLVGRTVQVTWAGTVVTLDFTNNAAKAVAVAPAPIPGAPPAVPGLAPPGKTGTAATSAGRSGLRQTGAPSDIRRPIRTGGGLGMAAPSMGMGAAQMQNGMAAAPAPVTRDQQEVIMEAMRDQQQNNPMMPPIPPTSLTPLLNAANEEAAANARASAANAGYSAPGYAPPAPPMPPSPGRLY